jgi:hypothetical protein
MQENCYSNSDGSFPVPQALIRRLTSEKSEFGVPDVWSLLTYGHY